jgi:NTP pyrophosphatase (non-canonical NTP hydrolase)
MTRLEHLLTIAAEECAEVAQRVAKAQRFGLQQVQQDADDKPEENPERLTNRERIEREFTDLVTVLHMAGIIDLDVEGRFTVDAARQGEKERKIERYLDRSRRCGTLAEVAHGAR